ncbi:hypothetical protein PVAP13_4NG162071 [Panicum virgatum]|uniref:Secreted protein n=1 Tax=Panicum virgatum TaxID=38727 RepID=A0A8T0T9V9_PANVG|nr:hypothetical protein PVAP13_4NG162071 [Panicum virgatum]
MPPFTVPPVLLAIPGALFSFCAHSLGTADTGRWRLYSVDAPLVDGVIKSYVGWCFHLFCHSPTRLTSLVRCWMTVGGARMFYERCYHQLQGGSSYPVSPGLRTFYHF